MAFKLPFHFKTAKEETAKSVSLLDNESGTISLTSAALIGALGGHVVLRMIRSILMWWRVCPPRRY